MKTDKKHISTIVSNIENGKTITNEQVEKMLLDYETARDKYDFLDFMYRELIEPGDTVTAAFNLWYRELKKYIQDRKADFLKQLNDKPKQRKSNKGFHQENQDWIQETWDEIREDKTSDRQADLELQACYQKRFDKRISTSQIQRFTGRQ